MIKTEQQLRAEQLLELHNCGRILVLPNIWDSGSARIIEEAGFPAIGTSSAGIAFTLGYADGQRMPLESMILAVTRIMEAVNIPVTADMEAGYGDLDLVAHSLLAVGAVGLNLEDMDGEDLAYQVPVKMMMERIRTVRKAAEEHGVHMVINARTDTFLRQIGEPETRLERTIDRMKAFADAGADCVFVPGVTDENTIAELVKASPLPVNILAVKGTPPVARLQELGVARVSLGSGPARAALSVARLVAQELLETGTYDRFAEAAISYDEMNELFQD